VASGLRVASSSSQGLGARNGTACSQWAALAQSFAHQLQLAQIKGF